MNLSIILLIVGIAIIFFAITQRQKDKQFEKDLKKDDPKDFFSQNPKTLNFPSDININVIIKKEENAENL